MSFPTSLAVRYSRGRRFAFKSRRGGTVPFTVFGAPLRVPRFEILKGQGSGHVAGREQAVFDHVRAVNSGPLSDSEMQHIYERLIDVMRTLQRRDAGTP